MELSPAQGAVVNAPVRSKTFLHGPAGTGKSTAGAERLRFLLARGISGASILVLGPQRTLQEPYLQISRDPEAPAGGEPTTTTIGGLARRMCELFWPLVSQRAGFLDPEHPPLFLTLETSQYYMAHLVRPLLEQGHFDSVTMDRNRLYSQILDSLNKSATVGFPYQEIGARLDAAWQGDPVQRRIYADAQDCATRFRAFCLEHNLLDFSLQLELFWIHLWPEPIVRGFLFKTYRHLIYDNVEEDVPRAHDMVRDWLPDLDSALLIFDEEAGYRQFLGADTSTGRALQDLCSTHLAWDQSFVMSAAIQRLGTELALAIRPAAAVSTVEDHAGDSISFESALHAIRSRFYPTLLDAVVEQIAVLAGERGVPLSAMVIVAPFLSDALRFALSSRLDRRHLAWRTHRPSRSLRDEPAARTLLALAAVAHPHWNVRPSKFDITHAFMLALRMDLVRAQLLTEIVYREKDFSLSSFDQIHPDKQDRITFVLGLRYARLRDWLLAYRDGGPVPLDHFLRRLFGEVLSQPGFGMHDSMDAARVAGSLVESVQKFRLAMEPSFVNLDHPDFDLGKEYIIMLEEGLLAAQYLESWRNASQEAVLLAPAYSFLMMNRAVDIQFWLDPGSSGWFQRLDQPLTHTRVLSREWPVGEKWTFDHESQANVDGMIRLAVGLLHRCRREVYLCISDLGETGFEQRGPLLSAFAKVQRDAQGA